MAAIIRGIVYENSSHSGGRNAGESGIPGIYVVLYSSLTGCVTAQTDEGGHYSFIVLEAGTYTVYVTGALPSGCPPAAAFPPKNLKKGSITVTQTQIDNGAAVAGPSFNRNAIAGVAARYCTRAPDC